jgi:hypothetical protein
VGSFFLCGLLESEVGVAVAVEVEVESEEVESEGEGVLGARVFLRS